MTDLMEAKKALLAEWEDRRDQLNVLITALRKELGIDAGNTAQASETKTAMQPSIATGAININELVAPGDFYGKTQVDAITEFLNRANRRTATLQEIAAALYRGKATETLIEGEKPLKNLSSLLSKTDVFWSVARGRWGLREWYPKSVIEQRLARKAGKNGQQETTEKAQQKSA